MEVAGTLTGGMWTDRPKGVELVLGELARAVNDHTSDRGRPELLPIARGWSVTRASAGGRQASLLLVLWATASWDDLTRSRASAWPGSWPD
ncbi:hypothetical protein F4558_002775 [Micromonospora profundi]|nr:hypothetical protein [Micromonospora profundi]